MLLAADLRKGGVIMGSSNVEFTLNEAEKLLHLTECLYDYNLSLQEFADCFMSRLKELVYFDKSDFMFFTYNVNTDRYEMQSFKPVNWSTEEISKYMTTYMHMDDVLPILSQPGYVAFRNSDLFSLEKRRETRYFQEFASNASLEISIDANIPLDENSTMIAILGLFRNIEKVEFSLKDLEIVKMMQPYLSRRMSDFFREEKSDVNAEIYGDMLDNIETLGVCTYGSDAVLMSNNQSYNRFAKSYGSSIESSVLTQRISSCVREMVSDGVTDKAGPIPVDIEGDTYMIQMAYGDADRSKVIVAVYYVSDIFTRRLKALKDEHNLSSREFEVLFLSLKKSMTNGEIADELFISEATVKRHIYTAYQKIGISNQKQLLKELQIL